MVVKELLCRILCNLRLFVTLLKIKFEGEIFCLHTPFPLVGLAKSDSPLEQKRAWAHCVQNERDNGSTITLYHFGGGALNGITKPKYFYRYVVRALKSTYCVNLKVLRLKNKIFKILTICVGPADPKRRP